MFYKNIKPLSALAIIALFFVYSCCREDPLVETPYSGIKCPRLTHWENCGCVCDSGYKEFWNMCIKTDNDLYYAKIDSCQCLGGEMTLEASRQSTGTGTVAMYDILIDFPNHNGLQGGGGTYFKKSNGDSISVDIGYVCHSGKDAFKLLFLGKFRGNDTVESWLIWHKYPDFQTTYDSCRIIWTKLHL